MIWKKFLSYLLFWKKQEIPEGVQKSSYLKMMHGINKLTILIFLVGIFVMIYRYFVR